jgi:hypothetical protein
MHAFATLGSSGTRCQEKYTKKKTKKESKEKISQSRYISRMHGDTLIRPIAMEVCISV